MNNERPKRDELVGFTISGKAMSVIEGSELSSDAVKYDGGTQGAHDALHALKGALMVRKGRGRQYVVATTRAGAETIRDYCLTVGSTFVDEPGTDQAEVRADGRALLDVAKRIRSELAK